MFLLLSSLASAGLMGPREIVLEVELPAEQPIENATYRSSTELYRWGNGRVVGQLEANDPHLACTMDGRWVKAEVAYRGTDFPQTEPEILVCENDQLRVQVHVVRTPTLPAPEVDQNRVALQRTRGKVQRASVELPVPGLQATDRVVADVRGVQCAVDVDDTTTVSVRISPVVRKEEATCELPMEDGSTYSLGIDLGM